MDHVDNPQIQSDNTITNNMLRGVNTHTEWAQLEEVIIGRVEGARIPSADISLLTVEYSHHRRQDSIPSGAFPERVIGETYEDLEKLAELLESCGVTVRRPEVFDHSAQVASPIWRTTGFYNYCPRDLFFITGRTVIEAPMVLRARAFETMSFRKILLDYLRQGAQWITAPKPELSDAMYDIAASPGSRLKNLEPAFDAANILRIGTDILYLLSDSGNLLGFEWLRTILGETYRVHTCRNLYAHTHIDSTISLIRPGLVLLNPARVNSDNLPVVFKRWDKLWCPEPVDIGYTGEPYSSKWIAMNLLMVNPSLAIVDSRQKDLIRMLERCGVDVAPCCLRHARTLGGGFHCVTVDTRRADVLESYVD